MRFVQAFVVAPAHCGELAVEGGVSAEFGAERVVGHVHHGGEFFGGVEHSEGFWGGFVGVHRSLRNIRTLRILTEIIDEKWRNIERVAIICYVFRTLRFHFGTFPDDFIFGANEAKTFTCVKDIFSEC
jgi:hypothetical protein